MKLHELKAALNANPDKQPRFVLPDGGFIPLNYHVTEVGHVTKNFVDCGGTVRTTSSCVLQTRLGSDEDHRLYAGKLDSILRLAERLIPDDNLDVEVEYEDFLISQFPLKAAGVSRDFLDLYLTTKHTDCLAKESCGIESSCCGDGCS